LKEKQGEALWLRPRKGDLPVWDLQRGTGAAGITGKRGNVGIHSRAWKLSEKTQHQLLWETSGREESPRGNRSSTPIREINTFQGEAPAHS